jgi:sensor c-di-GMP phosphodiesterase-like protein
MSTNANRQRLKASDCVGSRKPVHGLQLRVAEEGAETQDQADCLRLCGCDELQGNLFGKAVPLPELLRFLELEKSDPSRSLRS